jgi:thioredoxin reductase
MAYPTLHWVDGVASQILGQRDAFQAVTDSGETFSSRRILLAGGVSDQLPDVPGIAERWGRSVFHCPYCHGYELEKGHIGVIATGPMSIHQAQLLPEWGTVTLLTNGTIALTPDQRDDLRCRGVTVEDTPIRKITGAAEVDLHDGRVLAFAGLFTATRTAPTHGLAEAAGCVLMETPLGCQIQTADTKETSVRGIFACGDVARAPHSLSLAIADGAWAGAQLHRSLVWPEE